MWSPALRGTESATRTPTRVSASRTRFARGICSRVRGGACFGLGLASFAADTRQNFGEKAGGDIDFAAFYILPVPSSLSAKGRRVEIGSLLSVSHALAFASGWLVQLHEPPTSGGYVASHAAETHPPRPRPSALRPLFLTRDHRLGVARPTASGMCGNNAQTTFYNGFVGSVPNGYRDFRQSWILA